MGYNFSQDFTTDSVLASFPKGKIETVDGRVVNCFYRKPDTGFGIYEVETSDLRRFKAVGVFAIPIKIDFYYQFTGKAVKKDGEWQFEITGCKKSFPTDQDGILTILRTLAGLNMQANVVYKQLGKNALKIISTDPDAVVAKVKGVSMARAITWQRQLTSSDTIEDSVEVLKKIGIKPAKIKKLIDEFGSNVGDLIKQNPYMLVSKAGILTFNECDKIALNQGVTLDDPFRVAAAMHQVLKQHAFQLGNCFVSEKDFLDDLHHIISLHIGAVQAKKILAAHNTGIFSWSQYGVICEIQIDKLNEALDDWVASGKKKTFRYDVYQVPDSIIEKAFDIALEDRSIVKEELDGEVVYQLNTIHNAESFIAKAIKKINLSDLPFRIKNDSIIQKYCESNHIRLERKQLQAVRSFTESFGGFHVLCGSAGCGKTFTLKVILNVLKETHKVNRSTLSALILAPTGKAAKVASKSTGLPAYTIHKALGLVGDDGESFHLNQLHANCIVVDEFSMVDVFLAEKLLNSIPPTTKVIIMGDSDQLPSIGPGAILRDIVNSKSTELVTLDVVKRQKSKSGVLVNANKILSGEMIKTEAPNGNLQDGAFVYNALNPIQCRDAIVKSYMQLIEKGGYSISDIQILCPQKKTDVGVEVLNYMIQKQVLKNADFEKGVPVSRIKLSDSGEEEQLYFLKGDKVIHTENNYQMDWYMQGASGRLIKNPSKKGIINGEMGIIINTAVVQKEGSAPTYQILVRYDDGFVLYQNETISQLQHAYAMTVHRAQGSQWPITISPIMLCNYSMLSRSILYTLYTRAETTNIIFCEQAALQRALDNTQSNTRKTGLEYFMRQT